LNWGRAAATGEYDLDWFQKSGIGGRIFDLDK
jgi:hypothetical protein